MKSKTKMIVSTIFIALVCLMIAIGATAKIIGVKQVVEGLTHLGVGDYVKSLGLMEILFVALFLHSTTSKVGFIFLCCYFGGAMATHLSHGESMLQPAILLSLVWVAAFVRDKSIFFGKTVLFSKTPIVIL